MYSKLIKYILFEYNAIRKVIAFKLIKRKALQLHSTTGKRYYVMAGIKKPYFILDNNTLKVYRKNSKKDININNILSQCIFYTPDKGKCR